ncbi:type II toxin-antitoxin system Phd/YefM family antitoxin [Pseudomonas fluorescens]|uniref:Antitoxin n=1 Tax=Pseudomonas fluorescens TaxID=294 RepID=A0A5E7AXA5_PSEFL|nr:type II toxin-antitoxin system Phd/YefM family antitoxin [Pseudomonas fluorescens]VVN83746.1 Antitoxin YafN [Pseudomonas fluorescens]
MQSVLADRVVSVSDLKKNPGALMRDAQEEPIAVLNNNRIMGYLISADVFEAMIERLDDMDLAEFVCARRHEVSEPVRLDDL